MDELNLKQLTLAVRTIADEKNLPEETVLYQLQWLRNMEIIDNDEFFEMKRIYYSGLNRINTD